MSTIFPKLFSPFTIGKLRIKNRIVMLPHGVEFAVDNLPGMTACSELVRLKRA